MFQSQKASRHDWDIFDWDVKHNLEPKHINITDVGGQGHIKNKIICSNLLLHGPAERRFYAL